MRNKIFEFHFKYSEESRALGDEVWCSPEAAGELKKVFDEMAEATTLMHRYEKALVEIESLAGKCDLPVRVQQIIQRALNRDRANLRVVPFQKSEH